MNATDLHSIDSTTLVNELLRRGFRIMRDARQRPVSSLPVGSTYTTTFGGRPDGTGEIVGHNDCETKVKQNGSDKVIGISSVAMVVPGNIMGSTPSSQEQGSSPETTTSEKKRHPQGRHPKDSTPKSQAPVKDPSSPKGERKRIDLFGFPVSAVLKWCGKQGWDFAKAKKAMASLKVTVADGTVNTFICAGRSGQRGEPAALSKEQIAALNDAAK